MNNTDQHPAGRKTYYVYGSGLIPVPWMRTNEISRLIAEFHAEEAKRAMMLALVRKSG